MAAFLPQSPQVLGESHPNPKQRLPRALLGSAGLVMRGVL